MIPASDVTRVRRKALAAGLALASLAVAAPASAATFASTGAVQTYVVPAGVQSVHVDAVGGKGGDVPPGTGAFGEAVGAAGGSGARAVADVAVTPGQTLYVYVAGNGQNRSANAYAAGGFNGGGAAGVGSAAVGRSAGGGGGSDVRTTAGALASRLVVAGGGGGAGQNYPSQTGGDGRGGAAGMAPPAPGGVYCGAPGPGTQTEGGAGGANGGAAAGKNGTLGAGGAGGTDGTYDGAGGGGGYYGGGGGCSVYGQPGAGGSSYAPGGTVVPDTTGTPTISITPTAATAVTWRGGSAKATTRGVTLTWKTGRETQNLGFDVLRARPGSSRRTRVNKAVVLGGALASRNVGGSYRFVDRAGRRGDRYVIVERSLDGKRTVHALGRAR